MNDLPEQVRSRVRLFADDTTMYLCISSLSETNILQEDLLKLEKWVEDWDLNFNPEKCQVLHVATFKKVQVGKDQEKAQSEKDSHSKKRGGEKNNKKNNKKSGTYTMKHIISRMSSYFPNRWPLSYLNLTKTMKTHIRRQQHKTKFKHQDIKQKEPPQKYRLGTISNTKLLAGLKKVQVGKDQEKAQSEKDSQSKNQGGKIRYLYHETYRKPNEQLFSQ